MKTVIATAAGVSAVLSFFATYAAKRTAARLGMLDEPARHKTHAHPTPLLGGAAVFWTVLVVLLGGLAQVRIFAATDIPDWLPNAVEVHLHGAAGKVPQLLGILAAAALLHVLGLIDDKRALGPWIKLAIQILAAGFVVLVCGVRVLTLTGPLASTILTVLWIVGVTNAFNFLDNMDGLACGVAAICAAALMISAWMTGQWFVAGALGVLLGALVGFLPHNFHPAGIFLGDAGSLVIGFLLAIFSVLGTYVRGEHPVIWQGVLTPLVVLAVPIYDTFSVFWIRLREGRNPMIGDRRHFSHRLLQRGMKVPAAVLTIYLATSVTAASALVLPYIRKTFPALVLIAQTLLILALIAVLESTTRGTRKR